MVCGVILAGGMSRRFQVPGESWVDKALYPVSGAPMIRVIYDKLREVTDHVVVALGSMGRVEAYKRVLGDFTPVEDDSLLRGPLAGIYSALRACRSDVVIVTPVDMPYLSSLTLRDLLGVANRCDVVSPILPNGLIETTLLALRRSTSLWILEILRAHGRSRIADIHRGAPRLCLLNARKRGYKPLEFININRRDDLRVTSIDYPEGPLEDDVVITRDFSREDVEARSSRIRGSLWGTIYLGGYMSEFSLYASSGAYMLAAYALLDSPHTYERELGEMIIGMLKAPLQST